MSRLVMRILSVVLVVVGFGMLKVDVVQPVAGAHSTEVQALSQPESLPASSQSINLDNTVLTSSAVVSGTWNPSVGLLADWVDTIAIANDTLYAIHTTNEVNSFSRWQQGQWILIQTATVSDSWRKLQTGADGKLYAIHTHTEAWDTWFISTFNGTTWVDIGGAIPFNGRPNSFVALSSNQIYVIDNNNKLAIWNGTSWTTKIARTSEEGDFGAIRDLHLCGDRLYYVVLMAYSHGEHIETVPGVKKVMLNDQSIAWTPQDVEYAICEGDARYGWWMSKIIFGTETAQTRVFQIEPAGAMFTEIRSMVRNGSYIYVAGSFESIDGVEVNGLARWNGQQWEGIAPGFDYSTTTLSNLVIDRNQVYVAGYFNGPFGISSRNVAHWTASFNRHLYVPFVAK